MEAQAVIKPVLGELHEIGHGARSIGIKKLQGDGAGFGFHQGSGHGALEAGTQSCQPAGGAAGVKSPSADLMVALEAASLVQ